MYIRWTQVTYRVSAGKTTTSRRATLVRSVRVNGKPRQQVVCHLGQLPVEATTADRERFWGNVHERLRAQPADVRETAITQLARIVAPITVEQSLANEIARCEHEIATLERRLTSYHAYLAWLRAGKPRTGHTYTMLNSVSGGAFSWWGTPETDVATPL